MDAPFTHSPNRPGSSIALFESVQRVGGRVGEELAREYPGTVSSQTSCFELPI